MTQRDSLLHRTELERLIAAGNELKRGMGKKLSHAERLRLLNQWRDAKRDFRDPYGAHLRRVTKETKR